MNAAADPPLLVIRDLTIGYTQHGVWLEAVNEFSLEIAAGQTYGLVGESGSGKSTLAHAAMGYLDRGGQVRHGVVLFQGQDMLAAAPAVRQAIWGRRIALVPQDPLSALNPSIRVGEQLAESLRHHLGMDQPAAAARAVDLLRQVQIPDPDRVAQSYPHQLSGGMQQRVIIALALCTSPELLVLDEPTTNLDVTTQATVLDLICQLIEKYRTAALYVTHNLGVVAGICDRVAVLYAGELVEDAATDDLFRRPLHPYTRGLLDSVPVLGRGKHLGQLQPIPGQIPPLGERSGGCVFAPRCALALDQCHEVRPPLDTPAPGRRIRCHRWPEIAASQVAVGKVTATSPPWRVGPPATGKALSLTDVEVRYPVARPLSAVLSGRGKTTIRAVDGISLSVDPGRTLGLVGESGSGKTTLARAIMGLEEPAAGEICLLGIALPRTLAKRDTDILRRLQYVFQNPEEALNPYMSIGETLRRPLITLLGMSRQAADSAARSLLAAVSLPESYMSRMPHQLSGGEKQRIAIARAFAPAPDLIIADEAVSALDVSVQASILNLLIDLQQDQGNTLLFISHDLAAVGYVADHVAVIYAGHLMETSEIGALLAPPYHPYTEALLSAIPTIEPEAQPERIRLVGDPTLAAGELPGCPFQLRCPRLLGELCKTQTPPWQTAVGGKQILCHIPVEDLALRQGALPDGGQVRA